MKERLSGMLGPEAAGQLFAGTFHSLCYRLLKQHIGELAGSGRTQAFTVFDQVGLSWWLLGGWNVAAGQVVCQWVRGSLGANPVTAGVPHATRCRGGCSPHAAGSTHLPHHCCLPSPAPVQDMSRRLLAQLVRAEQPEWKGRAVTEKVRHVAGKERASRRLSKAEAMLLAMMAGWPGCWAMHIFKPTHVGFGELLYRAWNSSRLVAIPHRDSMVTQVRNMPCPCLQADYLQHEISSVKNSMLTWHASSAQVGPLWCCVARVARLLTGQPLPIGRSQHQLSSRLPVNPPNYCFLLLPARRSSGWWSGTWRGSATARCCRRKRSSGSGRWWIGLAGAVRS